MRSQRYFLETEKKRPVQMTAYVQCASFLATILTVLSAAVFGILASFGLGRKLLETVIKISIEISNIVIHFLLFGFFFFG